MFTPWCKMPWLLKQKKKKKREREQEKKPTRGTNFPRELKL